MEKRFNFNKDVDDLTRINEFFQNAEMTIEYKVTENQHTDNTHLE